MFTGLVEGQGVVRQIAEEKDTRRFGIELPSHFTDIVLGESIAINGCCLTVISSAGSLVEFQAGTETLSRTNLGAVNTGDRVNLERALLANGRFGGHIVQGHVDGVAHVAEINRDGEWIKMWFTVTPQLIKHLVVKGSVAIDGVSLTVVDVCDQQFSVALIPHTLQVTTFGELAVGDLVNIETDILGKYVERLIEATLNR